MHVLALLFTAVSTVAAQDWGTVGSWERLQPLPGGPHPFNGPPPLAFHHATSVPGFFILPGGGGLPSPIPTPPAPPPTPSFIDIWLYNIANNSWVNPFDTPWPASYVSPIPFVVAQGGNVVIIDEKSPGTLLYIDTQAPWDSGFNTAQASVAAQQVGRAGTRFFLWGSQLFMFGGVQLFPSSSASPNITYNDLYVMDLTWSLANPTLVQPWTMVSPPAQGNGVVAGYPEPRCSPTITPFHYRAFLFGGASRTLAGADPTECFRLLPAPADCLFHHHVYGFTPSSLPQAYGAANQMPNYYPNSLSASVWQQLGDAGINGAPGITGRVEHAAGAMGNQLFVYGGVTAKGPVSELWAYNLVRFGGGVRRPAPLSSFFPFCFTLLPPSTSFPKRGPWWRPQAPRPRWAW